MKFPNRFIPNPTPCGKTRREFLWQVGGGFAGLALIDLLSSSGFFSSRAAAAGASTLQRFNASTNTGPLAPRQPHFPTKAKRCVFFFMNGGPSQVDTFDPKPDL